MLNLLITGATGNVGQEVNKSSCKLPMALNIQAGVRDTAAGLDMLHDCPIKCTKFDITDRGTFTTEFVNRDVIFLLRPHTSDAEKYFKPLINSAVKAKIKHIVFLSVKGAEKSKLISHHTIEKLVQESKITYTFLRPAYFMQNFTTTLRRGLVHKQIIFLPAGNAKFTLVDVRDIGDVAAVILTNTASHINKSYELTCDQKPGFQQMADKLSAGLATKINYQSPGLLNFYFTKRKEKM